MSRLERTVTNFKIGGLIYVISLLVTLFTRKVFIEYLGDDLVGLSTMMTNVLGFFSLAEAGISGAVFYALYKPLYDNDRQLVSQIMTLFGWLYRKVGLFILAAALVLSLFLTYIFRNAEVADGYIYASFFVFLFSSLLGYFVNYKQLLIAADQRNYIVMGYLNGCNLVKFIIQAVCLVKTDWGYPLWLFWEVVFALVNSWLLTRRVKRDYGWLEVDMAQGREMMHKFPDVMKRAKQVFAHNVSTFVASQTDNILIFFFASLQWITIFGNYVLITSKLAQFVYTLLNNSNATVGNLIAEGDEQKTYRVFWQFMALRYLMGVTFIFGLARLTSPFITIWVGEDYLLDGATFTMMLVYTFITLTRATVDTYLSGFGLYQDVWASLTEAGLNLVISLIAGFAWGLKGVVFGTMVSMILMVFLWKPYFLFSRGFGRSVWDYWRNMTLYIGCGALMFILLNGLFDRLLPTAPSNYLEWTVQALIQCGAMFIGYGVLLYIATRGMRELFRVWWNLMLGILRRNS